MLPDLQSRTAGQRRVLTPTVWLWTATGKYITLSQVFHIIYWRSLTFVIICPSDIEHTCWRGADVKPDLYAFNGVLTLIICSFYKKQYHFTQSIEASYHSCSQNLLASVVRGVDEMYSREHTPLWLGCGGMLLHEQRKKLSVLICSCLPVSCWSFYWCYSWNGTLCLPWKTKCSLNKKPLSVESRICPKGL